MLLASLSEINSVMASDDLGGNNNTALGTETLLNSIVAGNNDSNEDAPDFLAPADPATNLTVTNSLPNPMSQVIVTDLMPDGLTIEAVNTSAGTSEVVGGKMLTVMIGSLPEKGEVAISISASVGANVAAGTQLSNAATLFYAESAADQAMRTINVSSGGASVAAIIADALASADETGETGETGETASQVEAGATSTEDTAEAVIPDVLPVTGVGVTLSFPLVILVVIGLFVKGFNSAKKRPSGFRADRE